MPEDIKCGHRVGQNVILIFTDLRNKGNLLSLNKDVAEMLMIQYDLIVVNS